MEQLILLNAGRYDKLIQKFEYPHELQENYTQNFGIGFRIRLD